MTYLAVDVVRFLRRGNEPVSPPRPERHAQRPHTPPVVFDFFFRSDCCEDALLWGTVFVPRRNDATEVPGTPVSAPTRLPNTTTLLATSSRHHTLDFQNGNQQSQGKEILLQFEISGKRELDFQSGFVEVRN